MKQNNNRGMIFALIIILLTIVGIKFADDYRKSENIPFSELMSYAKEGKVKELKIDGQKITGTVQDNGTKNITTIGPSDNGYLAEVLEKHSIPHEFDYVTEGGIFDNIFPLIIFGMSIVLIFVIIRQMQGASGRAMSFGKSRAKLLDDKDKKVTFKDVAGADEAKEDLEEIVEFLKDPRKFTRLGGKIPKGVLLVGPPGTGKTLLGKATAGEAGVPFFSISGSDFVEMFVGVGASRVRDLFEQGKEKAPCIIFIDEIDAVGRRRGAGMGGGHDEREQTLNQLLVEMDGFESSEGIILMAATNRPDVLDPALLRPGRFDRRVYVGKPDVKGREGILLVHTKKTPLDEMVDLKIVAKGTVGFSGADLANLVNEAAILAARRDRDNLSMLEFEDAKDKVTMGAQRKSMVIPEKEKIRTAYHEAGHALVATMMPDTDKVHKVTIIPRGRALGVTQMFPEGDQLGATSQQLSSKLAVFMGGRAAEELIFNEITTGAQNDIEQATKIARAMVTEYGMSDKLGPINVGGQGEVFVGRDYSKVTDVSEATSQIVDSEIRRLLDDAYAKATNILTKHKNILDQIATQLMEKETLNYDDFQKIIDQFTSKNPLLQKPLQPDVGLT